MNENKASLILLTALVIFSFSTLHTRAQSFTVSRVVDLGTTIPNGSGNFTGFGAGPAISGNNVAFSGSGSGGQQGIYLFDGTTLSKVADLGTAIPNGSGNFASFNNPVISGSNVAFRGLGLGWQGIYLFNGTTLSRVVDLGTPIPNGSGNFTGIGLPAISGSNVVFSGSGSGGQQGIYLFDGTTASRVVDLGTAIPNGSGNFDHFGPPPEISGSNVVIGGYGSGGQAGIYLFDGTTLSRVADRGTAIPNGAGTFDGFGAGAAVSGNNVVFAGYGVGLQTGIYLFNGIILSRLIDESTAIPNGPGNFRSVFGSPAISGNNVVFKGLGTGWQGIYFFDGTTLSRVADLSTPIPNGSDNFRSVGPPKISGSNVVFVGFGFTEQGIYLGSLNLPAVNVPIPIMAEWGIIILMILLGIGSFCYLKKHRVTI